MNKIILIGRLTKAAESRFTHDNKLVVHFSIAVDRKYKTEGEAQADFINCVAFGKLAETIEKYTHKGLKIAVEGELRNNNYTNKDGHKVYSNVVTVSSFDFCESKHTDTNDPPAQTPAPETDSDGFMSIPDGIAEELPFN